MESFIERGFRFLCALWCGAQLFFAAIAAQVVFSKEVAALPHGHPRRTLAAELVGQMLTRLDVLTLVVTAVTVGLAWLLARRSGGSPRRALWPLLAGLCATASLLGTTPAIQRLREANRTGEPIFGAFHALSSVLLLLEMLLFAWAALRAEQPGKAVLDGSARAG